MEGNKAYISCPMSVNIKILEDVTSKISKKGYQPLYWERGTHYNTSDLRESDVVVFILPNNSFEYRVGNLSAGIWKELQLAKELEKKTFIVYKSRTTGQYQFYECESTTKDITGIPGKYLEDYKSESKVKTLELKGSDNLILLLG